MPSLAGSTCLQAMLRNSWVLAIMVGIVAIIIVGARDTRSPAGLPARRCRRRQCLHRLLVA